MSSSPPDILLVEDNPDDLELTLDALAQHHVATRIQIARDGVEALDFIFGRGDFKDRSVEDKNADHLSARSQRVIEGRVVVQAKIAAEPHQALRVDFVDGQ